VIGFPFHNRLTVYLMVRIPLCLRALQLSSEGDDENEETRDNESVIGAVESLAIRVPLGGHSTERHLP
jgi:hypothetical protein